ncbi:MAG: helicase-related protein, partial [Dongiaceae bacterium]
VLDEADRMLDMGFIVPVKRIIAKLPKERQTLLFSATMPQAVHGLVASLLKDPVRVEVTPTATTAERVSQRVHFVEKANKRALLESLLKDRAISRALVFTRTKHGANKVAEQLARSGVRADAIHGNKSQNARQKALEDFRSGKVRVLVATDIAARGIDVDGITHVINFDLPNEPESYVHRIGRTARAGNEGVAISFCDSEERAFLRDIERTIRQQVAIDIEHPFHAAHVADGGRSGGARPTTGRGNSARNAGGRSHGKPQRPAQNGQSADRPHRPHTSHNAGRAEGEHSRQERRKQGHDHEARGTESRGDVQRARGSHGPNSRAYEARAHEQRGQDFRGHEQPAGEPKGQQARGQHSHAKHPPQKGGGHQPLQRQPRANSQSAGAHPQRFQPVRMG